MIAIDALGILLNNADMQKEKTMSDARKILTTMMILGSMLNGEFSKTPVDFELEWSQDESKESEDTDEEDVE